MCRLFGMSGAPHPVEATFWLLEAPDSLAVQSRREPDGTGLGVFERGRAQVMKQPLAAYRDRAFAQEAKTVRSTTFVAHVRFASTGAIDMRNTHPFEQRNRLFAHNGVIGDLPKLERELHDDLGLVGGDTDSERFFALITRAIDQHAGDVGAGISSAATWVAGALPVFSLNLILTTADELWALRYPDTHELWVLDREPGGPHGSRHLELASGPGRIHVRSRQLAAAAAVVVASERMDDNPGWRLLDSGELLHVDAGRGLHSQMVLPEPPAQRLTLSDLEPLAAASQRSEPPPA